MSSRKGVYGRFQHRLAKCSCDRSQALGQYNVIFESSKRDRA